MGAGNGTGVFLEEQLILLVAELLSSLYSHGFLWKFFFAFLKQNFTTVVQAASDLLVAQDDLELGGLPTSAYLYWDCDNLPQSPIPSF